MMDVRDTQPHTTSDSFRFPDSSSGSRLHVVPSLPDSSTPHSPRKLRIAQVAPLFESVPPKTYGGTERIVHYLTEGLVKRGHQVTLFASGDSCTSAELISSIDESLRLAKAMRDPMAWHTHQLTQLLAYADQFDIVHFHNGLNHAPLWRYLSVPQVSTLHNRLDCQDALVLLNDFPQLELISISDSQRRPAVATGATFVGTVYNGVPAESYRFEPRALGSSQGDYLAFLGRFTPDKGPEQAIEIAKRLGMRLKMAAKIDPSDRSYFEERIRPLLADPLIEYIGEADEAKKNELLGGATALLFPIQWLEPFGLVMIESMACGTPVVAFRNGAVDEVVKEGVSGFIVESIDAAVRAVGRIDEISRAACRQYFEANFSADHMVEAYLQVYYQQLRTTQAAVNQHAMGA